MITHSVRALILTALVLPLALEGAARASDLQVAQSSVVVEPAPAPEIVVRPPAPTVVVAPPPAPAAPPAIVQMLQAEDIKANEVRANTIYANTIEASEITGAVHQTSKVKLRSGRGDIKAPSVVASVIYADKIKAHTVIADHIYVRHLDRE
jgi:hypothetical protein